MLLSVESPLVGTLAFVVPGATLLLRNGLVQAVLRASDWNMCKRTMVSQELGRTHWKEVRRRIYGIVFEKHGECIEIRKTCPPNRSG